MNWFKTLIILFGSVILSLHAQASVESNLDPSKVKKDSIRVEPKLKFNPLMLFSLPKAVEPIDHKSTTKEDDEELGAI